MANGHLSSSDRASPDDAALSKSELSPPVGKPRSKLRLPLVPFLGMLFLSFLFGAVTMFFRFPMSGTLTKAFMGARAWTERHFETERPPSELNQAYALDFDRPGKTFDGYTLYAGASQTAPSTWVSLIDMRRNVVHRWSVSFTKIWPNPTQVDGREIGDSEVCIFACHLYPNGDLLVVFHSLERSARGYGLAKVDKDSKLLWSYAAQVHHDVRVGEDGTIYTIVQRLLNAPIKSQEYVPPPWQVDYLVMLSPEGKELREPISIFEALRDSRYSALLSPLEASLKPSTQQQMNLEFARSSIMRQDVLHANSVDVLSRAMSPKFPEFKAGQILLSMRSLHALAVLDPSTSAIVWGARGPWSFQHDAQFLDNGNLLLFDNAGSQRGSRVLEYNPRDYSFPWSYPGVDDAPFITNERGMAQRLPNGNTLIVVSEGNQMIEVTPSKEVVWTYATQSFITTARRYGPDQLLFLRSGQRPRE
jgi:hypothetical protein